MKLLLNLSTTILMSMLLGILMAEYVEPVVCSIVIIPIVLTLRVLTMYKYDRTSLL